MSEHDLIRRIEELSFNAWPALGTVLYDGWLLRFANGYTKRANSVNGLYPGDLPLETKIDYCETVYRKHNLHPIFRLTPLIERDDLDQKLQARRFKRIDHTSVQLLDLAKIEPIPSPRAAIIEGQDCIASWLDSFHDLNPQRRDAPTHEQILHNIIGELCLLILAVDNVVVSCGLAVADGDYLGLFDIVTDVEQRRQGYGLEVTSSLLAWGQAMNTRFAFLQVMTNNGPALNLYSKLGFQEIYDYWYRIAPDNRRSNE